MKKENLEEYMNKINFEIGHNLAEYTDLEKGIIYPVTLPHLIPNLDYIEATDDELKRLEFDLKIEKGMTFTKTKITRPYPKYEDTKKEEDKNILIDKEYDVNQIWNVTNALNLSRTFNNKKDAIEFYLKTRENIVSHMEK
jgi:hypothetical protein